MRITQSMLSNNMLRNLSGSYNRMGKLQEQINTQKKVNRPSDDPVVVMKSLGYGMQVDKVDQYKKNLGEVHNWLDSSDDALNGVGEVLHRATDLVRSAANTGSMTDGDRQNIKAEIKQLRGQLQDLANTKVGDKYIFSGTNTDTPLYKDGVFSDASGIGEKVKIEVFDGVSLNVNTEAKEMFSKIDSLLQDIDNIAEDGEGFGAKIEELNTQLDVVLTHRADIGARSNRAELMSNRLDMQEGAAKKQRSENEDVDIEVAITELITAETIHRASLSVGARIIQPSLVDFLR